ncbi:AAA family ATPase [Brevibacterium album]|uniref:AAA family ATPase n=1 Tax=Brevibacterium album TaxID=417948 RepID=UPI00041D2CBF|nr:ATP-binding protein [Brevibacterium album]
MSEHTSASAAKPSSIDLERFAVDFHEFITAMSQAAGAEKRRELETLLGDHLGVGPRSLEPVRQEFPLWRWADVDAALEALAEGQALHGVVPAGESPALSEVLANQFAIYEQGAVERQAVPVGPGAVRHVATNAIRLLRIGSTPAVVYACAAGEGPHPPVIRVEVLSADERLSRSVLADVEAHMREGSVLSGQVVSFIADEFGSDEVGIEFHPRPRLTREDIVLPEGTLERIEASVLGMSENAAELRAVGQHLARGVLLYGPPGTGKTHTVRYLLSRAPETTAILLQGGALSRIRQAAATARSLGRAIIVLEDADLVAADRDFGEGERAVLFDVLDVLDGLDDDADIAFVLTTNRVDVLEEALALRPGRIDLAVEVPLPTRELRRQLLARSARELPITEAGIELAALASAGTTGSFAKEAVRRAVLSALAAGEETEDRHLLGAVSTLVAEAAELREAMNRDALSDGSAAAPDEGDDFADGGEAGDWADGGWTDRGRAAGVRAEGGWAADDRSGESDGPGEERDPDHDLADYDEGLSGEDLLDMDDRD